MYCPSCGSESQEGLNFCKQCGYSLNSAAILPEGKGQFAKYAILFGVIALVGLIGIVGPFVTAQDMAHMQYGGPEVVVALVLFGSVTAITVLIILIWLLFRLMGATNLTAGRKAKAQPPLTPGAPRVIAAPPNSITSITEHTTRNFEPGSMHRAGDDATDR